MKNECSIERLITLEDLIQITGLSKSTIYNEVNQGKLIASKVGKNQIRFKKKYVESYIDLCSKEHKVCDDEKRNEAFLTLRRIKRVLDPYFKYECLTDHINSKELYEIIIARSPELNKRFKSLDLFYRFMKEQYDSGLLIKVIKNCKVDNSVSRSYKWKFYKSRRKSYLD